MATTNENTKEYIDKLKYREDLKRSIFQERPFPKGLVPPSTRGTKSSPKQSISDAKNKNK